MPFSYGLDQDLMPRNAPKPAPLIEVAATPLVPELSLLLDHERSKSVHFNTYAGANSTEVISSKSPREEAKDISSGNEHETYKSWKAKNAHYLSTINRSAGNQETLNGYSSSHKVPKTQCTDIAMTSVGKQVGMSPREVSPVKQVNYRETTGINYSNRQVQNVYQEHTSPGISYPQTTDAHLSRKAPEGIYTHQYKPHSPGFSQKSCLQTNCNEYSQNNEPPSPNFHHNTKQDLRIQPGQSPVISDHGINQSPCQCGCRATTNKQDFYNSQPNCYSKDEQRRRLPLNHSTSAPPLDIAQVNNQAILDLYHIINIQNEQIALLQQQVKQILQIHLDCVTVKKNDSCEKCKPKHSTNEQHCCGNSQQNTDIECNRNKCSNNKAITNENIKRSVGVMTNFVDTSEEADDNVVEKKKYHLPAKVKQKKKHQASHRPVIVNYARNQKGVDMKEEKTRARSSKTTKQAKQITSNPMDNSFSLNEAELVIRTASENDDLSPNTSVHVDLQDYYSSSGENDSESIGSSSSGAENRPDSESEDSTAEPQIGWTFYNRVVGQVNNILKKTPTTRNSRQEPPQMFKTPNGYKSPYLATEFEPETNWSKRVTFDGPPLEDSSEHTSLNPRYQHLPPQRDMQGHDGNRRMQDFMMYNFANGNTNLSFASLRYLDRHHKLPSQRNSKPSVEDKYQDVYQSSSKRNTKKKNKYQGNYQDITPHRSKRKSNTPSSKVLDVTALKQQPKLL